MPRASRAQRGERDAWTRGKFNKITGNYRIGGLEVAFDPDLELDTKAQPTPLFPDYDCPRPTPLTSKERSQVAHFRSIRSAIQEGPYYSVLGNNVRVGKESKSVGVNLDPFEGMPTWSKRYTRSKGTLPRLDARPHVLKFFPKELWSTLDPKAGVMNGASTGSENKRTKIGKMHLSERTSQLGDKTVADTKELEEAPKEVNDEEEDPMEPAVLDDEFDEDDDEGGDYNAEGYFDDGGDDAGDFGGDDGDGGDYF